MEKLRSGEVPQLSQDLTAIQSRAGQISAPVCLFRRGVGAALQIFADGVDKSGIPELRAYRKEPLMVSSGRPDSVTSELQIWTSVVDAFYRVNIMSTF